MPVGDPLIGGDRQRWTEGLLVDHLAPLYVSAYLFVAFEPLGNAVFLPGFVSSLLLPAFGAGILLLTPSDRIARIPVSLPLAALLAWMTATYVWSIFAVQTFYAIRSELGPLVVLTLVAGTMSPPRILRTLLFTSIGFLIAGVAWAVVAPAGQLAMGEGGAYFEFRGGFGHKNELGMFGVYALCFVLPFVWGRWRIPLIGLCLVNIVGSRSATAASGLLAVMFAWIFVAALQRQRNSRERQVLVVIGVACGLAAVLTVVGLLPVLLDLYEKDATFSGRTDIWAVSIEGIAAQPVEGYGFGAVWGDGRAPVTRWLQLGIGFPSAHAHNSLLEVGLEGGLIAMTLVLAHYVQTMRLAGRAMIRSDSVRYGQWGVLTVAALIIMGIAEPLVRGPHLALIAVVWIVLALLDHQARRSRHAPHRTSL